MTDRAYTRISLDTMASGSIDKQRSALQRKAAPDAVFYEDRSTSGSIPFAQREGGARLLADLRPGDRVLVTKIDRAARSMRDLLELVQRIEDAGATITFTEQEGIDNTPVGGLMLKILGAVAEFERELIAERRRESLTAFREEGRHAVGRAPFGLRSVPNPNGRGLVLRPDPDAAPILREAVADILAGGSQRSWSSKCGMQHPAFGRLLRNPRLAGVLEVSPDEGVRLDPEMAVFSFAEWTQLQEHLTRRSKTWSRADGIGAALRCGVCGDRLYLNVAKRAEHSTYRCRKAKGHGGGEPGVAVIAANADRVVEKEFLDRFGHLQTKERVLVGDESARAEAMGRARMQLDAVRAAQDAADEDEEETLFSAYLKAKKALREAEAIRAGVHEVEVATGKTFAQEWADVSASERTGWILSFGPWVVEPGRRPLDEKVHLAFELGTDYLAGQCE